MSIKRKCTYQQIKEAIRKHGPYQYMVQEALGICDRTLTQYKRIYPSLNKMLKGAKKRTGRRLSEKVIKWLDTLDPEGFKDPVVQKWLMRLFANVDPNVWGVNQKSKVLNSTNIGSVNITQNNGDTPQLTEERKKQILDKALASQAERKKVEVVENGLKELPAVLENAPPQIPYNIKNDDLPGG